MALALGFAPGASAQGALTMGGGELPGPVAATQTVSRAIAIGLAVPQARDAVRARVAVVLPCSGKLTAGDDLLLRVPLNGDAFSGSARIRSDELGAVRVRLAGMLSGDRATGTVRVTSTRGKRRCDTGTRAWVARVAARPAAAAPAPVAGSTLLGVTEERASIPHGVVALLSADGTALRMATSFVESCRNRVSGRTRPAKLDIQFVWRAVPVVDGRFRADESDRESAAERRKRIRYRFTGTMSGGFAGPALAGSFRYTDNYREPGFESRCSRSKVRFHAVPA